ncbi:hypothetical protein B0H19DRAFT_1191683 [Mycena capillaripes]|nr:hypothetical protein B0H19DRAFT_1191683 [Mycena capillaripes]
MISVVVLCACRRGSYCSGAEVRIGRGGAVEVHIRNPLLIHRRTRPVGYNRRGFEQGRAFVCE